LVSAHARNRARTIFHDTNAEVGHRFVGPIFTTDLIRAILVSAIELVITVVIEFIAADFNFRGV